MIPELPTEQHKKCALLLEALWRGIAPEYKSRYRRTIWTQFQEEVEGAARTTNSLSVFVNSLCSRFSVSLHDREAAAVGKVLSGADDRAMLKLLREQTVLLVVAVRLANQERREEWEAQQEEALNMSKQLEVEEE